MNREGPPHEVFGVDSSPEYCRQAIEKSLKRLGLPFVDLYYVHRLDKVTLIEKTIAAVVELKNEGMIKHLGLSECSADSLRRAHAVYPITCVQVEYSAFCLDIESPQTKLLETARELGVAVVAYSPLGNGFLTGVISKLEDVTKPGDLRAVLPWFKEENMKQNVAVVDKVTEIAIFAIPGTTKIHRLEENLGGSQIAVSQEEDKAIRELSQAVIGGRFQASTGYAFGDTPAL